VTDSVTSDMSDDAQGRRRRLKIIIAVAAVAVLGFVVSARYSQRRVDDENARIQRVASTLAIAPDFVLAAAYGGNSLAAQFEVAEERVAIEVGADGPCIAVRSEYLGRSAVSSFVVRDGALALKARC
jgi:hypothetical protein